MRPLALLAPPGSLGHAHAVALGSIQRIACRAASALLFGLCASSLPAAEPPAKALPAEDRVALEAVIRDYIMRNPAVVRDALEKLRLDEQAAAADRAKKALTTERDQLLNDPGSPWIGSATADVTVVEFFDYRCGFCKQVSAALFKLAATDPKVRIVLKDYPILGPESTYAARVSLAARRHPKFGAFHAAMLAATAYSPETVRKIAVESGIDPGIFTHLESAEINAQLEKNTRLALALGLTGTPALVVGGQLTPGAISFEALAAQVAAARAQAAPVEKH